ncbi:MAG: hypothetical protein RSE00_03245 [Clostridia bacterium]
MIERERKKEIENKFQEGMSKRKIDENISYGIKHLETTLGNNMEYNYPEIFWKYFSPNKDISWVLLSKLPAILISNRKIVKWKVVEFNKFYFVIIKRCICDIPINNELYRVYELTKDLSKCFGKNNVQDIKISLINKNCDYEGVKKLANVDFFKFDNNSIVKLVVGF